MKKTIITIVIVLVIIIGLYFVFRSPSKTVIDDQNPPTTTTNPANTPGGTQATSSQSQNPSQTTKDGVTILGKSVEGRNILAYHYGAGATELVFVGGIHGGYEWNTVLVAQKLKDYLKDNPTLVPANVRVTVIPVLNPDGLNRVVGTSTGDFTASDVSTREATVISGRFNGQTVDLNRNFDCDWQATGKWQNTSVSGGSSAFSEPESLAIKNYIESKKPSAVIVWYSAAGGVYASNCHNGVSEETNTLMNTYAKASGYKAYESFDFYSTTGDMTNWLAKNDIPAVSVLLTNHTDTEWSKNLAGIQAVIKSYSR